MKTITWCVLLSLLFASMPAWSSDPPGNHRQFVDFGNVSGGTPEEPLPAPPTCTESVEFSESPEEFRWQLIDYFHQIEFDLAIIMSHPVVQSVQGECVPAVDFQFADTMEQALLAATSEEIEQLQSALSQIPELSSVPARLEFVIEQLPSYEASTNGAEPCPGDELWQVYAWKTGANAMAIAAALMGAAYNVLSPFADDDGLGLGLAVLAAIAAVLTGAADVATLGLQIAADWSEFRYQSRQNCLADLCVTSTVGLERRGRGCDGVDQDCLNGPDDCMEDRSAPLVELRRTVEMRCYRTLAAAKLATYRHTSATDDCNEAELDLPQGTIPDGSCDAVIQITATDGCDNVSSAIETVLTVDDDPPLIECHVTLDSLAPANNAFVNVGLSYTVSDECDGAPLVELTVTSDEPTATSYGSAAGTAQAPDALITRLDNGQFELLLRAERSSSPHGDGRVYRARVQATDRCGNSSFADCLVSVSQTTPATQAINSGQNFDATAIN